MSGNSKLSIALGLSVFAGMGVWYLFSNASQVKVDTGNGDTVDTQTGTDTNGRSIIESTGKGGIDDGKKVSGYELPESASSNQYPLEVVLKPNKTLFDFKAGDKIVFPYKRENELVVFLGTVGGVNGEYVLNYPDINKITLGSI